jgi:hypothetical protein
VKHLDDSLADNDSPITDHTLVVNTLRRLGPRFASVAMVISMIDPLPTILQTCAMLLKEEMQQDNAASNAASTALVVQARGPTLACTSMGLPRRALQPGQRQARK